MGSSSCMGSSKSQQKKPDLCKFLEDQAKNSLSYGIAAMKGWRNFMEDSHIAILNFGGNSDIDLFGVFDGHGGCEVALLVKDLFPDQLAKNENFIKGNYSQALTETFIKMDKIIASDQGVEKIEHILEQQSLKGNCYHMGGSSFAGCTALICLITRQKIYIANAGDCRAIASVSGQCQILNVQHRPTNEKQQQRIKKAGGFLENDRINGDLNVSRCIGDMHYKQNKEVSRQNQIVICDPEITQLSKSGLDFIFMGCDGVWEKKSNFDMLNWIKQPCQDPKLSAQLARLLDQQVGSSHQCYLGMDNMSTILIKFQ